MSESDILNIEEAGKYLKLSKPTLYKYTQEGRIPATRMGKAWKFHKQLLDEWLIKEMREASENRARKKLHEK